MKFSNPYVSIDSTMLSKKIIHTTKFLRVNPVKKLMFNPSLQLILNVINPLSNQILRRFIY